MWRKHGKQQSGNSNATHRQTDPGMKPSWREVKESYKSIQKWECMCGGERVRVTAHTQAAYGMYKNIVTSKF